jgi:hypothetical protein
MKTNIFFTHVSSAIGEIFLKIQAWETTHICYKLHKLDCNPLIIKDTLHEEEFISSPVS